MTSAERDRLRSEALRLLVEAAIAAGGDLDVPRGPVVKALLRRGAGRTFAYDTVAELLAGGDVERELARRGALRRSAEKPSAASDSTALSPDAQPDPTRASLALLDGIGYALFEIADADEGERERLIHQTLALVDQTEELLRRTLAPEVAAG